MDTIDPTPVRLRPVTDNSIGTTAFFRNRSLFDAILDQLEKKGQKEYKILFHACSIGAEVYSFVIYYLLKKEIFSFNIKCVASDKEQGFIDFARSGNYPLQILDGMTCQEIEFFEKNNENVIVKDCVKECVEYYDVSNFIEYSTEKKFEVVFLLNALVYVQREDQKKAIKNISKYNNGLLIATAFHMDDIKDDMVEYGYVPVISNIKAIHESWRDRRVDVAGDALPKGVYAKWWLPLFSEVKDYEYKYCAIFEKV